MSSMPVSSKPAVPRGGQDGAQAAAGGCDLSAGDADGPADSLAASDNVRIRHAGAVVAASPASVAWLTWPVQRALAGLTGGLDAEFVLAFGCCVRLGG